MILFVLTIRTDIDGLYHFDNIPKGEYTIHVQDPNVKEPNWGPAAYRRVSLADDNAVIDLDPTVIDYSPRLGCGMCDVLGCLRG